jgi:hypothetical protein
MERESAEDIVTVHYKILYGHFTIVYDAICVPVVL